MKIVPITQLFTLEGRLRWGIDSLPRRGRRRGVRLFQSLMQQRAEELERGGESLDGASLSSVQTYLNGNVVPSLSFLKEAANVLGLREAWLILGQGLPTQADAEEDEGVILLRLRDSRARHPTPLPAQANAEELEAITGRSYAESDTEGFIPPQPDHPPGLGTGTMRAFEKGAGVPLPFHRLSSGLNPYIPAPSFVLLFGLYRRRCEGMSVSETIRVGERMAEEIGRAVVAPLRALGLDPGKLALDALEEHVLSVAPVIMRAIETMREHAQEA